MRVHRRVARLRLPPSRQPLMPASPAIPRPPISVTLPLGWLALEGVATHDWKAGKSRLAWRLCADWESGPHAVGRKMRLPSPLPSLLRPSARWEVRTLEPSVVVGGGAGGGEGAATVACSVGRYALSLPTLQLTLRL